MAYCTACNTEMKKEIKELDKGIYATVYVCPKCKEELIDKGGYKELYDQMYTRKLFKIGGSIGVRIPKKIMDIVGLNEDSCVKFDVKDNRIIIQKA